jgi:phage-related protein (TIGR01555 family)
MAKSKSVSTADGLVNVVSGLGTTRTKRAHNTFQYATLTSWQQLDAAFQTNWLARQIVEVPAEDMTREWRTIKSADAEAIRVEEDRHMIPSMINDALCWARLFGGAGVLMITGQDLTKPLNVNRVKKGDLQRVIVFDRYDMASMVMNTWNVLSENYLRPEFYAIAGGSQHIHWSHFARFNGAKLPRRQMAVTQGWGDSELRKCLDDIMDMIASKDGIAELMQEANVDVITREGLADELASDQDTAITDRYALFAQMKSVVKLALLDGDETYDRKTLNLSGVAPIIELFMTWISGAADIPLTRLFGTSAKGLNATGEGDQSNYFNSIRSKQTTQVDPGMRVLDEVLVRSALGYWPEDYNYTWNPLTQPGLQEVAAALKINAERDQIYVDMDAVNVSQVMRNLQSDDIYQFEDEEIEERQAAEEDFEIVDPSERVTQPSLDSDTYINAYRQLVESGVTHGAAVATLAT